MWTFFEPVEVNGTKETKCQLCKTALTHHRGTSVMTPFTTINRSRDDFKEANNGIQKFITVASLTFVSAIHRATKYRSDFCYGDSAVRDRGESEHVTPSLRCANKATRIVDESSTR